MDPIFPTIQVCPLSALPAAVFCAGDHPRGLGWLAWLLAEASWGGAPGVDRALPGVFGPYQCLALLHQHYRPCAAP